MVVGEYLETRGDPMRTALMGRLQNADEMMLC